jgi:hypothetical protein
MHKTSLIKTLKLPSSIISLTHDAWTSRANWPFAAFTAHWVNDYGKLYNFIFNFYHFLFPHTSAQHIRHLKNQINVFGISSKVTYFFSF